MLLTAAVLFLPTIWIVDASNGPGTNFTDLPAAVAAAANGDTLMVRNGVYRPFQVSGKALTIRGVAAGVVIVRHNTGQSLTVIDAVPPGAVFAVYGVSFVPVSGARGTTPSLSITGTTSVVALSHVVVTGNDGGTSTSGAVGLSIDGASVYASASTFRGGSQNGPGSAGTGAVLSGGTLVAVDCSMIGGTLQTGFDVFLTAAGSGLRSAGFASLYSCTLTAGSATGRTTFGGSALAVGGYARVAGTSVLTAGTGTIPGYAILASAGSSAVVNGNVTLVPVSGQPATSGQVTLGGPSLPRVDVISFSLNGEADPALPMTVAVDGLVPLAPILLGFDVAPTFSNALAPLVVGEVFLPVGSFVFGAALDGAGHFAHTFAAGSAPAFVGVPVFGQVGVFDLANSQILMSNLDQRIYR
jgi:hypothetical protein